MFSKSAPGKPNISRSQGKDLPVWKERLHPQQIKSLSYENDNIYPLHRVLFNSLSQKSTKASCSITLNKYPDPSMALRKQVGNNSSK